MFIAKATLDELGLRLLIWQLLMCLASDWAVATPLWGVCIFEAIRPERRAAPWLQRSRIWEKASRSFERNLLSLARNTDAPFFMPQADLRADVIVWFGD